MKISKVADEMVAPSWAFGSKSLDDYEKNDAIIKSEVERINATPKNNVSEAIIAKECEAIEKCASSGKVYHYNSTWSDGNISHLKEYASVCGLDQSKVKGVDPTAILNEMNQIEKQASASYMIKTASTATLKKIVLADPFHIDEHSDTSHMDKEVWQRVDRQSNLEDAPAMNSGVRPLRGGENYFTNSDSKLAANQNSITNPDAIKQFVESEKQDTGARLKQEKQERINAKVESKKEWEKDIIAAMEHNDIVSKGSVFPTEVMNAQPGLNNPSSQMGVYSKMNKSDIPDKTAGEKIREERKSWNDSIKRPEKTKDEFQMEKAPTRIVSDTFAEELKKYLK